MYNQIKIKYPYSLNNSEISLNYFILPIYCKNCIIVKYCSILILWRKNHGVILLIAYFIILHIFHNIANMFCDFCNARINYRMKRWSICARNLVTTNGGNIAIEKIDTQKQERLGCFKDSNRGGLHLSWLFGSGIVLVLHASFSSHRPANDSSLREFSGKHERWVCMFVPPKESLSYAFVVYKSVLRKHILFILL